jgi:hypothetical protein
MTMRLLGSPPDIAEQNENIFDAAMNNVWFE